MQGWPVLDTAREVYHDMFSVSDIVLASVDDMTQLLEAQIDDNLI